MLMLMIGILNQKVEAAGEKGIKSSIFNDMVAGDPNIVFINYISHRGIIKGYPDGSFHPQAGLTRAEAAAILVKTSGLSTPQVTSSTFTDVPATHWASAQIAAATNAGYLKGFPDGTYQPEAKVTRAQGIALVMRLCTQIERSALPRIGDMDSQHWAAGDMATALALEMIGLSKDSQNIYPDAEMSRGSLARALAILLTKDPGLNAASLEGRASEAKGQVTLIRQGKSQELKDQVTIIVGDTIKTGENSSMRINYPDGTSNLVEANSEIIIKQADGRRYIKEDGSPGIAVEYLNIGMVKGTMFGGVATKHGSQQENTEINPASESSQRFDRVAALQSFNYLAAADSAQAPWYKTAEKKKVKVKVDMPWGVAAIRGTYVMITVNQDGSCRVSCLTGNVDVSSNNSNQGVSVGSGMTSGIAGENSGAQTAAPMTEGEKQDFGNLDVQDWILQSALQQDVNQEAQVAPPVLQVVVEIPDNNPTITAVQVVLDALTTSGIQVNPAAIESLKQQIEEIQNQVSQQTIQQISQQVDQVQSQSSTPTTPGNNTSSSGGSSGGSSAGVTLPNPGAQSVTVGQSITLTLSPNPSDATITATSSVPGVATVTVSGGTLVINGVTVGTATINVNGSKSGYQSTTVSFTVTVSSQPVIALTDPGAQNVTVGQSITVALGPNPADVAISATSSDPSVATVAVSGNNLIIAGVGPGTGNITVTAQKTAYVEGQISFSVNVNNPTEQRIYSNWNGYGGVTGPTSPTTFTLTQPFALTFMNTYHHNSPSEAPGIFSLVHEDGTVYGPWNASGGYSSLICYVNFKGGGDEGYSDPLTTLTPSDQYPILKPGTYTMLDSNGATWTCNGDSGFAGFLQVKGYYRTVTATDNISSSFTDTNFKQAVWEWLGNTVGSIPGSFSKQDLINRLAAQSYNLDISSKSISSLAGLEHFEGTNITGLSCSENQLTALPTLPTSLTELTCKNNQLTSLPTLPASLTNTFRCDLNYLDIWQGTIQSTINGCPAGNKIISPQYKYVYEGTPVGFPAAGATKQLVMGDLQRVMSTDGVTWTSPVNAQVSDFVFSTSNSSVATVTPGGNISAAGNGDCYIYANYKGLASNFTRVAIPVYVSGLNNVKIARDDDSNNLVLLNVGSSLEYATNATDSSGTSATWNTGTGSEVTISASGSYVVVREMLNPANTRCLGYINPALTNNLVRTSTSTVNSSCINSFAYNGLVNQMDISRLTGQGSTELDERYARAFFANVPTGTIATSGVVNSSGTTISSSDITASGTTMFIPGFTYAVGNDLGITVQYYGTNGSDGDNSADDVWFLPSKAVTIKATTPDGGAGDYIDVADQTGDKIRIATVQANASAGDRIWCSENAFIRTENVLDSNKQLLTPGNIYSYPLKCLQAGDYVSMATEDQATGNVFIGTSYGVIPAAPASAHVASSANNPQDCINASNLTSVQLSAVFSSAQSGTVHFQLANSVASKYVDQTVSGTDSQFSGTMDASTPTGGAFTSGETLTLNVYLEEASGNRGPLFSNTNIKYDVTVPVVSSLDLYPSSPPYLSFNSSEAGTYYYMVYAAADPEPSADIIIAQGTAVASGTGTTSAGSNSTGNLSGLNPSTNYKAYLIVLDSSQNVSAVAVKDFTTAVVSYTVSYNGNGHDSGTVPSSTTYDSGSSTTVADNTDLDPMVKSGCSFIGWNTAADWAGTDYGPNSTINAAGDTTLYAKWRFNTAPDVTNLGFKYDSSDLEITNSELPDYTTLEIFISGSTPTEAAPVTYELKYTLDLTNPSNRTIGWHYLGGSGSIYEEHKMWYRYINGTAKSEWMEDGNPLAFMPVKGGWNKYDFTAVGTNTISFKNTGGVYNGWTLMTLNGSVWTNRGTINSVDQSFTVAAGDQIVIKSPAGNYSYASDAYSYP